MKKIILGLSLSAILLIGCDSNKGSDIPEFQTPRDQYGARYSVGDLGGKPVNLGREAPWVEYDDNMGFVTGRKYKRKVRTYQSKIQAFGLDMRYTDGLVLVVYYKAPPYSEEQYKAEIGLPDNYWVSVGVGADRYYNGDLTARLINSTLEIKTISKKNLKALNYINTYLPTEEYEYSLQKYVPHAEWIKENNKLMRKNINMNKGIYDIDDLYVEKDPHGKVLTLIKCGHSEYPIARTCEQEFVLEPEMKVSLTARFQSIHLQDWQLIQQQAKKVVLNFVLKPDASKKNK